MNELTRPPFQGERTEGVLADLIRDLQAGHVEPPGIGRVEIWLWRDDPEAFEDWRPLYEARPDYAQAIQGCLGLGGVLDCLYASDFKTAAGVHTETQTT